MCDISRLIKSESVFLYRGGWLRGYVVRLVVSSLRAGVCLGLILGQSKIMNGPVLYHEVNMISEHYLVMFTR